MTSQQTETRARPYIGGQAVLEGVMMRSPTSFSIAIRRADGSLVVRERAMIDERTGFAKLPFIRGLMSLVESLKLGNEALRFSADQLQQDLDTDSSKPGPKAAGTRTLGILSAFGYSLFLLATGDGGGEAGGATEKRRSMGPLLLIMIAFMVALPQLGAVGLAKLFHLDWAVQSAGFQALTGAVKLSIVLGYLLLIRRVPDIRRVFQYHGAEHKTISTYEAHEPLDVAHARTKTTLHPRCGTTFLVMVVLVSIAMFTVLGAILPRIDTGSAMRDNILFFLLKLPALPVLVAVTFELQRILARYCTTGPLRALLVPGFLVQRITTIEPDDDQLEVALASLGATLQRELGKAGESATESSYPSFEAAAKVLSA